MNSLRKTFLALSLISVFPATVQAFGWADIKNMVSDLTVKARDLTSAFAGEAAKLTKAHPYRAAAIGAFGTAGVVGACYLAKKYVKKAKPAADVDSAFEASTRSRKISTKIKTSAARTKALLGTLKTKFSHLSRNKKAGVVIGGTVVLAGAACLVKSYFAKADRNPTE